MDARRSLLVKSFYETVDSIRRDIHDLKVCIRAQKYDPNQPRVPAGQSGAGRWSGGSSIGVQNNNEAPANRRISADLETICADQYAHDTMICNTVRNRACHEQAMFRFAACLRRQAIPPLSF